MIHSSAIIDDGAQIGTGCRIWHFVHVCSGAIIGDHTSLGQGVFVGGKAIIGKNCKIQNNVSVYDGVVLENDVFVGPSAVFTNVKTPRAFIDRKAEFQKTHIKQGATIGANATIVCGVTIGRYCLIGAGAVVTTSVPDFALFLGVPARQHGWVSKSGCVLDETMTCPHDDSTYTNVDGVLKPR